LSGTTLGQRSFISEPEMSKIWNCMLVRILMKSHADNSWCHFSTDLLYV
jgi:hypothetical protein